MKAGVLSEEAGERPRSAEIWRRVYFFSVCVLVGVLCFGAGLLTRLWQAEGAMEMSIVAPQVAASERQTDAKTQSTGQGDQQPVTAPELSARQAEVPCPFVGSRNSDKYHIPTSSCAKRILPANLVCFSSVEDAQKKGYIEGCLK